MSNNKRLKVKKVLKVFGPEKKSEKLGHNNSLILSFYPISCH